jgi:hypothetical protein
MTDVDMQANLLLIYGIRSAITYSILRKRERTSNEHHE